MSQSLIPVINSRIPNFVKTDYPAFQKYLVDYFTWLESDENFLQVLNDWKTNNEPSLNVEPYIDAILRDLGFDVAQPLTIPKSTMLHFLRDFYLSRGTEQSFHLLFKVLFGKTPRIEYPREELFIPSYAEYGERHFVYVSTTSSGTRKYEAVLNNAASLGGTMRGQQSKLTASVESVLQVQGQTTSYLEVEILLPIGEFLRDETCIITVGDNAIAETVMPIAEPVIISGGAGYSVGDRVNIDGFGKNGSYVVSKILKGDIDSVVIDYEGRGYVKGDRIADPSSNNFSARVSQIGLQGRIAETEVTSRGYNYATIPNLIVYKNGVPGVFRPKGPALLTQAQVSASSTTIGRVLEIEKLEPYVDTIGPEGVSISSAGQGAMISLQSVTRFSKKGWASNRGFIGENTTLIDSDVYQQFSYKIVSDVDPDRYLDLVDSLLHPVGYVRSAVIEIQNEADIDFDTDSFSGSEIVIAQTSLIVTNDGDSIITEASDTLIFTV